MTRWKAASIHLSISATVALCSAALIFGVWYPAPYAHAAGAFDLILVLLCVDLVLGPLLTCIVYKQGKPGMRFDLAVIGLLQASAFSYGLVVVSAARPVFVVGTIDRFVLVSADALADEDLAAGTTEEFRSRSWTGPRLVNALRPEASSERTDLLFSGAFGKDLELFPKYYADYATHAAPLLERAQSLDALARKPGAPPLIDAWLSRSGNARADVAWLPLVGRGHDVVLLLNRSDGRILDMLPIDPW